MENILKLLIIAVILLGIAVIFGSNKTNRIRETTILTGDTVIEIYEEYQEHLHLYHED